MKEDLMGGGISGFIFPKYLIIFLHAQYFILSEDRFITVIQWMHTVFLGKQPQEFQEVMQRGRLFFKNMKKIPNNILLQKLACAIALLGGTHKHSHWYVLYAETGTYILQSTKLSIKLDIF